MAEMGDMNEMSFSGGSGSGGSDVKSYSGGMPDLEADTWRLYGTVGDYFSTMANATMQYANATLRAGSLRAGAAATGWGARLAQRAAHRTAGQYARYAGDVQAAGEEAAANRRLLLGRDVGRMHAGAAGAGIDLSSRTVTRAENAARLMAERDAGATLRTAAQQANRHMDEARTTRLNADLNVVNADLQSKLSNIQANYEESAGRANRKIAQYSAWGDIGDASNKLVVDIIKSIFMA